MRKRLPGPIAASFICMVCYLSTVFAQPSLEDRIAGLENRVRILEAKLDKSAGPGQRTSGGQKSAPQRSAVRLAKSPVSGSLLKKELKLAGAGEKVDNLALLITFKNNSQFGIASFKADLVFKDIYADSILALFADITKAIPAGMSNSWYGGIPYDASNSTHRRLLELDNSSIVVDVRPEKIVFVDGTVKTFSQKDAEGD